MGYTSDVVLVLRKDAMKNLEKALKKEPEETQKLFTEYPDVKKEDTKTGAVLFNWQNIKWYYDDKAIDFTEQFIDSLDRSQYRFVKLGDDNDDIEDKGGFYNEPFYVRVVREIKFNVEVDND